jgi:hypothetical protein
MDAVRGARIEHQGKQNSAAYENPQCYERGFSEGADFLYNNMWIPCSLYLPTKSGRYFTINLDCTSPDVPDVTNYDADTKTWYTDICNMRFFHERSHWMPIPPLPKKI